MVMLLMSIKIAYSKLAVFIFLEERRLISLKKITFMVFMIQFSKSKKTKLEIKNSLIAIAEK